MKEMPAIVKVPDGYAKRMEVGDINITKAVCRNTNSGKYESFAELDIIKPNEQTTVTSSPTNSNEDAWVGIVGYILTIGGIYLFENRKTIVQKCKEGFKGCLQKCKKKPKQKTSTVVKYTYTKETTESNNKNNFTNIDSLLNPTTNNVVTTKETHILEVEGDCEKSLEMIKNLQEQSLKSKVNSTKNTLKV